MGELIVLAEVRLAREVRREHELVVPAAGADGRVPAAPTLGELEELWGDDWPEGRFPGEVEEEGHPIPP